MKSQLMNPDIDPGRQQPLWTHVLPAIVHSLLIMFVALILWALIISFVQLWGAIVTHDFKVLIGCCFQLAHVQGPYDIVPMSTTAVQATEWARKTWAPFYIRQQCPLLFSSALSWVLRLIILPKLLNNCCQGLQLISALDESRCYYHNITRTICCTCTCLQLIHWCPK